MHLRILCVHEFFLVITFVRLDSCVGCGHANGINFIRYLAIPCGRYQPLVWNQFVSSLLAQPSASGPPRQGTVPLFKSPTRFQMCWTDTFGRFASEHSCLPDTNAYCLHTFQKTVHVLQQDGSPIGGQVLQRQPAWQAQTTFLEVLFGTFMGGFGLRQERHIESVDHLRRACIWPASSLLALTLLLDEFMLEPGCRRLSMTQEKNVNIYSYLETTQKNIYIKVASQGWNCMRGTTLSLKNSSHTVSKTSSDGIAEEISASFRCRQVADQFAMVLSQCGDKMCPFSGFETQVRSVKKPNSKNFQA